MIVEVKREIKDGIEYVSFIDEETGATYELAQLSSFSGRQEQNSKSYVKNNGYIIPNKI